MALCQKLRTLLFMGVATSFLIAGPYRGLAAESGKATPGEASSPPPLALSTTPEPLPLGSSSQAAGEKKRINLWPLFFFQQDPLRKTKEINFLGPLIRSGETEEESFFALSPLFFTLKNKKTGDSVSEFLWPYGASKRRGNEERTRLSPLFEAEKGDSPRWGLFPIYGGKSSKGESYGGVFPFYGTIKERFGQDEGSFLLFPLFAQSRQDETTTTHVLWPFFSSTKGPERGGFKAWPFFGWKKEVGRSESSFALWPFWSERRRGLDTNNPEHFWMLFPFFGETKSPDRDSVVVLWPFIHYANDKKHHYSTFSLFPLLTVAKGADREAFKLLPFFGYEKTANSNSSFIVAPFIYGTRNIHTFGYTEKRTRWLFFSKDREKTWTREGETSKFTHVWPFAHYKKSRKGAVQFAFPSLFPIVSESYQRNWPFLTIYGYRRDEAGREASTFLWNLFTSEKDENYSSMELAYIFDYSENVVTDTKEFSLLKGLFSYRSSPKGNRYSFFYLPWGIKTAPRPEMTLAAKKTKEPEPPKPKKKVHQRITFESVR